MTYLGHISLQNQNKYIVHKEIGVKIFSLNIVKDLRWCYNATKITFKFNSINKLII